MEASDALAFATRLAEHMMGPDPEAGSIAGWSAFQALRTYDPERGIPLQRYLTKITRINVYYHWRKEARHPVTFLGEAAYEVTVEPDPLPVNIPPLQWRLLVDYYINNIPLYVLQERLSLSRPELRTLLQESETLFREAYHAVR